MKNEKLVWAKIKTLSNFRGLNGGYYKVAEIISNRVSIYHTNEWGKVDIVDFTLQEVEYFKGLEFSQEY